MICLNKLGLIRHPSTWESSFLVRSRRMTNRLLCSLPAIALWVLLILSCFTVPASAQEGAERPAWEIDRYLESRPIREVKSSEELKAYLNAILVGQEFQKELRTDSRRKPVDLVRWLREILSKLFRGHFASGDSKSTLFDYLVIGILTVVVGFVAFRVLQEIKPRLSGWGSATRNIQRASEDSLSRALAFYSEDDFVQAIRYGYLGLLQRVGVSDARFKTDSAIINMRSAVGDPRTPLLQNLVHTYQGIWYGKRIPSREETERFLNSIRTIWIFEPVSRSSNATA